jgi:hypothetical protein
LTMKMKRAVLGRRVLRFGAVRGGHFKNVVSVAPSS